MLSIYVDHDNPIPYHVFINYEIPVTYQKKSMLLHFRNQALHSKMFDFWIDTQLSDAYVMLEVNFFRVKEDFIKTHTGD